MGIPKNKKRITVTLHEETVQLLDELVDVHKEINNFSYSQLVEIAIIYYANMIEKQLAPKEEKDSAKN